MKNSKFTGVQDPIEAFVASASAGDIEAIRTQVAQGFDLNCTDRLGDTVLERVISELACCSATPRYEVIREMLHLGADPGLLSDDGSSPLFTATLHMDSEMLRILLDAGADPNQPLRILLGAGVEPGVLSTDAIDESLYDWAEFAYRYEVWHSRLPAPATAADTADQGSWLLYLDRLAVTYGKRRPDYLRLLRARGALALAEVQAANRGIGRRAVERRRQTLSWNSLLALHSAPVAIKPPPHHVEE
jgi:hypothetical protein